MNASRRAFTLIELLAVVIILAITTGSAAYPTIGELGTVGTVMQGELARNPYNNKMANFAMGLADANTRATNNIGEWAYYVNNFAGPTRRGVLGQQQRDGREFVLAAASGGGEP